MRDETTELSKLRKENTELRERLRIIRDMTRSAPLNYAPLPVNPFRGPYGGTLTPVTPWTPPDLFPHGPQR